MTDDPSQVDTDTLLRSAQRDVEAAFRWLTQARVSLFELERRRRAPGSMTIRETSTD